MTEYEHVEIREALNEIAAAVAALGATARQNQDQQSSVEIAQSAKGVAQVKVKIYAADPRAAADQATALYDELVARYAPKDGAP